jgi:integrase
VNRSLKTKDRRVALSVLGRVEETLRLIEQGRLEVPPKADPARFILSDGKISQSPASREAISLRRLFELYVERLPTGAKEGTTIGLERTHIKNFLRLLPAARIADTITASDMQRYVEKRLTEKRGTRFISPETIKREMDTFRSIWNWGRREYIESDAPTTGLLFAKRDEKPPFMTWSEIQVRISRGGLTEEEHDDLWACLYLTTSEIADLLEHTRQRGRHPFIHPMLTFVAYTGVRRSEMMRSRIDDFDFELKTVLIREKKRSRKKAITYRRVDLAETLTRTLKEWFAVHPGGQFAFCMPPDDEQPLRPLTRDQARDQFRRTFRKSKWERVRGFHVLRHSFASNLASRGVDQRVIDAWMGHQTEEMRQRYRHLLPSTRKDAIELLTA